MTSKKPYIILFVTSVYDNPKTGPATFARILHANFVADHIHFKIITSDITNPQDHMIQVGKTRIASFVYYRLWRKVKEVASDYPSKHVIIHYNNSFPYLCFGKPGNISIVQLNDYCNAIPFYSGKPGIKIRARIRHLLRKYTEKVTLRKADKIFSNSNYTKTAVSNSYRLDMDRFEVIRKSINIQLLSKKTNSIPIGTILFIGNNYYLKGLDILLESLQHDTPVKKLIIVGPSRLDHFMKEKIAILTSKKMEIHLSGPLPQSELYKQMIASDIVIIPGRYESLGVSVIEALAQGVPVITGGVGGLKEILGDYPVQFWDAANLTSSGLAGRINQVYEKYDYFRNEVISKMQTIRKEFSSTKMIASIYRAYEIFE